MDEPARKLYLYAPPARKGSRRRFEGRHVRFLRALARRPLTDAELAAFLGVAETNARGRRGELVALGLAEKTASTRETPSGRAAAVWRITAAGKTKLAQLRKEGSRGA